jgi:hypothetical protein
LLASVRKEEKNLQLETHLTHLATVNPVMMLLSLSSTSARRRAGGSREKTQLVDRFIMTLGIQVVVGQNIEVN